MKSWIGGLAVAAAVLTLTAAPSGIAVATDGPRETVWAQRDANGAGDLENGIRAAKNGDWQLSIRYLERFVERDPQNADALGLLGTSHRKLGHLDQAVRYFEAALAIDPDNRTVRGEVGETYLALHQPEKARAHAAALARLCPRGCSELTTLTRAIAAQTARGPGS